MSGPLVYVANYNYFCVLGLIICFKIKQEYYITVIFTVISLLLFDK